MNLQDGNNLILNNGTFILDLKFSDHFQVIFLVDNDLPAKPFTIMHTPSPNFHTIVKVTIMPDYSLMSSMIY